ncbi:glycosyltransferase family 2 protein [Sphingobacterium sp. DN00404]|uniref:Glycosyltransferase family 2 protein n=2 Tax=Sphingobacterium micropteri TaxID=2763501 RepID=A0ABR7YN78_9SPHI|nr:glycosyltransferase family 2 protein [Sphingobacterium micropteri]
MIPTGNIHKLYNRYLIAFDKDFHTISDSTVNQVRKQLQPFHHPEPLVSMVVIAHNEAPRILACLWSLSEQVTSVPMELIVVNNNSTDMTEDILKTLDVVYYNETRKGPGFARQCGLDHAKGKYIICIDADTLYPSHYVTTHLKSLQRTDVSCAFSLWSFLPEQKQSKFSLLIYEAFRDFYLMLQYIRRPELCVRGMVFSFKSEYAKQIGFRTDIIRGEDGSLALALKQHGKIAFIRDRRARAITGHGTLGADGSLFNSFKIRLLKAIKSFPSLFSRTTKYRDEESNLIDKTK